MVDELLSAYPHQLTFSEAGMRIMITDHFSPRTRLTMASRLLINEVDAPSSPPSRLHLKHPLLKSSGKAGVVCVPVPPCHNIYI